MTAPVPQRGQALSMTCEWAPHVPRRLAAAEWQQYRAGRDAFVGELAAAIGGSAVIVEV